MRLAPPVNRDQPKSATTSSWSVQTPAYIRHERILLMLAGLFTLTGLTVLWLVSAQSTGGNLLAHLSPNFNANWLLATGVVWAAAFCAIHTVLNRLHHERDPFIVPLVALLSGWGLIETARLAPNFLVRQLTWLGLSAGVLILVLIAPNDLKWLRRYKYTWLIAGLALLALTFVVGVNPEGTGLTLWLGGLLGVFFQPSELLKLLFVAYLAAYLAEKREIARSLSGQPEHLHFLTLPYLLPVLAMWGVTLLLLAAQQDLGSAILIYLTFLVMLYVASGQARYLVIGAGLLIVTGVAAYFLIGRVHSRVDTWLTPWNDAAGSSYQIVQSLIALASGGRIGQGLGFGWPHVVLPAAHTDMPLAAIGEELGLAGTIGLVLCFAVLTVRGLRIALTARTTFGRLLAAGLAASIGVQAWIIMAGNANLAPLTGVTLPFVSYGGSSLLISFIMVGLLLQVSADRD